MIVYRQIGSYSFLAPARKEPKEAGAKGAVCLAHLRAKSRPLGGCAPKRACGRSRNPSRPLAYPPAASPQAPEHLILNPVQAENILIFCLKDGASENGWAEIGTFPPGLLKSTGVSGFGGDS